MSFEVGQLVRVADPLTQCDYSIHPLMHQYAGKLATIAAANGGYHIDLDNGEFFWCDYSLTPAEPGMDEMVTITLHNGEEITIPAYRKENSYQTCDICGLYYERGVSGANKVVETESGIIHVNVCGICEPKVYDHCACGNLIPKGTGLNGGGGRVYGHSCWHERYALCTKCGKRHYKSSSRNYNGEQLCRNCADELELTRCDHCGEWHPEHEMNRDGWEYYCDECTNLIVGKCSHCGEQIFSDSKYLEIIGRIVCGNCTDSMGEIDGYSHTRPGSSAFASMPGETTRKFLGVELEVETGRGDQSKQVTIGKLLMDHNEFKRDGSLDDGFEMVTMPCTYRYHMEAMPYKQLFELWGEENVEADDTTSAGLHVHVSRDFFTDDTLAFAKLALIFDKCWSDMVRFSRRDYHKIQEWAKKNRVARNKVDENGRDVTYYDENDYLCFEESDEAAPHDEIYDFSRNDRYHAINNCCTPTLEFRLFKSTININTFLATLEFVDYITDYVEQHEINDCMYRNFAEIFENTSESFKAYCRSVGIRM